MATNIVTTNSNDTQTDAQQLPERERIILPAALLKSALAVAAKNDVRYYLNGVQIIAEGRDLRVVGTDGHRMLVVSNTEQSDFPAWLQEGFVIDRDNLSESLGLLCKLNGEQIAIEWAPGHKKANLRTLDGNTTIGLDVVDGKFPDWRRIVESSHAMGNEARKPMETASVNSKYLKEAGAVASVLGATNISPFIGKADEAILFTFDAAFPALLYIMPVRVEQKVSEGTLRMIGSGLKGSIAAFRAHRTRLLSNLNLAKTDAQKLRITSKIEEAEKRIIELTSLMNNPQALPAA